VQIAQIRCLNIYIILIPKSGVVKKGTEPYPRATSERKSLIRDKLSHSKYRKNLNKNYARRKIGLGDK